ncbi:MAG: flagellin FliC [Magnetococcales bacterium]|nr:flagellin FliC [Magnetococcales bacterium]
MGIFINTNLSSMHAQHELGQVSRDLGQSFERLSSGHRVNSAADDASGLSIGTRMSSQVRGFNQAIRNANDGVSLMQTVDGALAGTAAALQRIRDIAVQSANDTVNTEDRETMWLEVEELVEEIDRIASDSYNGQSLLSGGTDMTFHIGANKDQTLTLTMDEMTANALGVDTTTVLTTTDLANMTQASGQEHSETLISLADSALNAVSDLRGKLGAADNRFQHAIGNMEAAKRETSGSRAQIMDTDFANETGIMTRKSILQQATTAMLAQANAQPQLAMQLLG